MMDESIINFAKKESLDYLNNQNFKNIFDMKKIALLDYPNDGVIVHDDIIYTNKCFFISISQGLLLNQINYMNDSKKGRKIIQNAFNIMKEIDFIDQNSPFELTNISYLNKLENLFPNIKILIYFGSFQKSDTLLDSIKFCDPEPKMIIGKGEVIIRLCLCDGHYTLIISEEGFIREQKSKTIKFIEEQNKLMNDIYLKNKQINDDYEYARNFKDFD